MKLGYLMVKATYFLWGFCWAVALYLAVQYFETGSQRVLTLCVFTGFVASTLYPFRRADRAVAEHHD